MNQWRCVSTTLAGASAVAFDSNEDLLWLGSPSGGNVHSLFLPALGPRYTAWKNYGVSAIATLLLDDKGVCSMNAQSIKYSNRRGLCSWQILAKDNSAFTAAAHTTAQGSEVLVGSASLLPTSGSQPDLLLVSTMTGQTIRKIESNDPISHFARGSHMIASGSPKGRIHLRDPRALTVQHSVEGHSAGLTGLEAEGHLLVSTGFSAKTNTALSYNTPDPLVKVYDIRNLRALAPLPFPSGPAFVKIHPRSTSTLVIANLHGAFQIVDMSNPSQVQFHQAEVASYLTGMALSPTGEALAFTDAEGELSLWTSSDDPKFSRFQSEIELPDPVEPPKQIEWTPHTPLNMIGMPYYSTPLLSQIPIENWITPHSPLFRPTPSVDPAVLANLRIVDRLGYAPNPKTNLRNQALPPVSKAKRGQRAEVPHFVSEKDRRERVDTAESLDDALETLERVPQHFRKVEIQYSRFGVEDFDFAFYNKTQFSGLETHIINSYTNALLQCLHYLLPVRRLAEAHTKIACAKENCLLCELGFLFRMLSDAKGVNCQASNFSRAFTASAQAAALGLMDFEEISQRESYVSLIQTFNRFIIESMGAEAEQMGLPRMSLLRDAPLVRQNSAGERVPSPIIELFALNTRTVSTCFNCQAKTSRDSPSTVLDLIYPRKALSNETSTRHQQSANSDFAAVVMASISRETTTKTVCAACRNPTHLRVKRTLVPGDESPLPPLLAINAGVHTPDNVSLWLDSRSAERGRFLRERIALARNGDGVLVTDETQSGTDGSLTKVLYQLRAIIVQVQTAEEPPHLVSIIRIPEEQLPPDRKSPWFLFNDFLVRPISADEALGFPGPWKIPAVLYFERIDQATVLDLSRLPADLDRTILNADISISRNRDQERIKHTALRIDEVQERGSLVAIDAEFVSLQDEEVEYRSDGPKRVIRPTRMSLARVSVLRGQGEDTGVPFIDDHIHTSEPIVDYLTEFSGIRAGDLDPLRSPHTLVPLKTAYKKLRLLVDLGCVFIGHGLAKDFRIINIYVPREQIIDTVDIYHMPERHRKLSLRFLAYTVLHSDVQGGPTHDSIEDARTALQLYEAYSRLAAEGKWEDALEDIYREGHKLMFKVPVLTVAEQDRLKPIVIPMGSAASQVLPEKAGVNKGAPEIFCLTTEPEDPHVYRDQELLFVPL